MTVAPVREAEPSRIESNRCRVGVVGLGYVGLPQAMVFAGAGHPVVGVDVDPDVVRALRDGRSVVDTVADGEVRQVRELLRVTGDATELAACSAIMICVPTPVDADARPDLAALRAACHAVADQLVAGQLVVVESTVHPGATDTVVKPILETSGLVAGVHFNLAFAPERIDPGNRLFGLANTPKVVGGYTSVCARRATELYRGVVPAVHVAKGLREAEAAKILENTYRQVNLALVHEFAEYCEVQGIDVTSVIEAAATKPFGYQPFYPGVGVGGHCIPVDPLYLVASAREQGTPMRLVETAQKINDHRPLRIAEQCRRWLATAGMQAPGARVLVLGVTYKPDVADVRNTPVVGIVRGLRALGIDVSVHDPLVDGLDVDRDRLAVVADLESAVAAADLVLVAQRHSIYTGRLLQQASLLLDASHRR